jgi:hypothetical protein
MKYSKLAEQFENMRCMPLFEIAMINDNYLLVDLSVEYRKSKTGSSYPVGIRFTFDQRSPDSPYALLNVSFDGNVKGKNGSYLYPFDDCFSLDEHLQEIYGNIMEGFILPNNLYSEQDE